MTYDPSLAPRHLDEGGPDIEALERAHGIFLTELGALQQVLDVFREDGWKHIDRTLEAEVSRIKDELAIKTFTPEQIANVQGQIRAFEYLRTLPDRAGKQFKILSERNRQVEAHLDGERGDEIVEHPA